MKKSVLSFVLIMATGLVSHALSINPASVEPVVADKIYRSGTNGGGYGTPVDEFSYPCANGFTMVLNAYANFGEQQITCPNGRSLIYAGAHWQKSSKDGLAAAEIRRGGKVLVHCRHGVDASNLVAWIGAARAGLMSAQAASNGFYTGQKGSLGDAKYREMAAMILQRGQ